MRLPFLNRETELARLKRSLARRQDSLLCLYGRRRLGKSRLIQEAVRDRAVVYYVGDERDAALQREALAREVAVMLPGFAAVTYPGWDALLERWWREAPVGAVLVLDEFTDLVAVSPDLPQLLRKLVDRPSGRRLKTILTGSSQRMMLGLLLDATAPLYGRAEEILKLEPMGLGTLGQAFRLRSAGEAVEHYAVWGGVPRYWELARDYPDREAAVEALLLDPLGVLHREPDRLLLDDMQEATRAASILALIGQGSHRISEIGGRLGHPVTSLSRPLSRLVELGFVSREIPFSRSARDSKRSIYRIADPMLRFWYRFVEPNRSRLAAGAVAAIQRQIEIDWPSHLGGIWEDVSRASVPRLEVDGVTWSSAARWWGSGTDRQTLEIDIVASSSEDPGHVLVGEAKLSCRNAEVGRLLADLRARALRCPDLQGKRLSAALWVLRGPAKQSHVLTATDVVAAL